MDKEIVPQIETLSLRDYIDKKMTKLHQECQVLFDDEDDVIGNLTDIMNLNSQLIALQDIAYRLEYGFIAEMGKKDLKHHLTRA